MSDEQPTPDPALKGAGLSATGKTADQFSPGDPSSGGATYGDPGGTGSADQETTQGDPSADLAQGSGGNAEGGSDA